jgi:hypothetical protein
MDNENKKAIIEIGDNAIWVNGWTFDSKCGVRELASNMKDLLEELGIEVDYDR